ncbi:uncharacterized protein LOC133527541 [Cydia pomonella]|uniref:uncharacterized protein LOC133527541 n=1 Tax=Cydia pomonella TaxID=82600 RepID=UPI002ADD35BD|nr:uncharacterized protein LOC133527541 [Cydia pomonella]
MLLKKIGKNFVSLDRESKLFVLPRSRTGETQECGVRAGLRGEKPAGRPGDASRWRGRQGGRGSGACRSSVEAAPRTPVSSSCHRPMLARTGPHRATRSLTSREDAAARPV